MSNYIDTRNDPDGLEIEAEYSMAYEETEEMKQESRLKFGRRKYGPEFTLDQFLKFVFAPLRTILHKACRFAKRIIIAGLKIIDKFMAERPKFDRLFYRYLLRVLPHFLTKKQRDLKRRLDSLGFDTVLTYGIDIYFEIHWPVDYCFTMFDDKYVRGIENYIEYYFATKDLNLNNPDELDKAYQLQMEFIRFRLKNEWHPPLCVCNRKVLEKCLSEMIYADYSDLPLMMFNRAEYEKKYDDIEKWERLQKEREYYEAEPISDYDNSIESLNENDSNDNEVFGYDYEGRIRMTNPNPEIFRD